MSEPEITQDEQDVEGHARSLVRNPPENESDAREALDDDDDVEGHRNSVQ